MKRNFKNSLLLLLAGLLIPSLSRADNKASDKSKTPVSISRDDPLNAEDLKFKQAEVNQADAFEKMASSLSPEVRAKYDAVMEAADIYFASEAERLIPLNTEHRPDRTRKIAQSRFDLYQVLLSTLQKLEQTSKLQVSRISFKQTNDVLNHALELYQTASPQQSPKALLRAQKDWINYRDSFANYGIARFQPKNLEMWKAELTRLRALDFAAH